MLNFANVYYTLTKASNLVSYGGAGNPSHTPHRSSVNLDFHSILRIFQRLVGLASLKKQTHKKATTLNKELGYGFGQGLQNPGVKS